MKLLVLRVLVKYQNVVIPIQLVNLSQLLHKVVTRKAVTKKVAMRVPPHQRVTMVPT